MKKFLSLSNIALGIFALAGLVCLPIGIASASTTDTLQPASTITYDDELVVNNTARFDSIYVGRQDVGGVTFFNGTIVNNTTNDGVDNPVTFGDNVRIDGRVFRGENYGPGLNDNMPFIINDDMQVEGDLVVSNLIGNKIIHPGNLATSNSASSGKVLSYNADGKLEWITIEGGGSIEEGSGDITAVSAGSGLSGGGTSGSVTLSVADDGITNAMLGSNAVTSAKIQNGTITGDNISSSADLNVATGTFSGDLNVTGNISGNNILTKTTEEITYYVETTGSDDTGDGSVSAPFATIQKAIDELPEVINHACYINVGSGTFQENAYVKKLTTAGEAEGKVGAGADVLLNIKGTTNELLSERTADSGDNYSLTDTGAFTGQDYSGKFMEVLSGSATFDTSYPNGYYYYTSIHPILSNNDDTLQLPNFGISWSDATYRIIENATILTRATDYGRTFSNYSANQQLFVKVESVDLRGYTGFYNEGKSQIISSNVTFTDSGYNGVENRSGGNMYTQQSYISGNWLNAGVSHEQSGGSNMIRHNVFANGNKAIEDEQNHYTFLWGNRIYNHTSGIRVLYGAAVEDYGTVYENNAAIFDVGGGGTIHSTGSSGSGNTLIARMRGTGSLAYESAGATAGSNFQWIEVGGIISDLTNNVQYTAEDDIASDQSVSAGTAVAITFRKTIRVAGNGGPVTVTATPSVADGLKDGQELIIQGTSDVNTVTLQDEGTLASSGLSLSAINMVLGNGDMLVLRYDLGDDKWYEVSRSDN